MNNAGQRLTKKRTSRQRASSRHTRQQEFASSSPGRNRRGGAMGRITNMRWERLAVGLPFLVLLASTHCREIGKRKPCSGKMPPLLVCRRFFCTEEDHLRAQRELKVQQQWPHAVIHLVYLYAICCGKINIPGQPVAPQSRREPHGRASSRFFRSPQLHTRSSGRDRP